jgi:PAS domain S-box-containing protein
MTGYYDHSEVARSVLIAIAASYAALDLTGRVAAARGRVRLAWLSGGAITMGIGIWAMHFKGMLAFHLPVSVEYYWPTTLAALLVAIFASAFALYVASQQKMRPVAAFTGSIFMGAGIAGMHYIGMAAMRLPAITRYSSPLVTRSVLLAILFSLIALLMAFGLREETRWSVPRRLGSAIVMGVAVSAMHFTGMAAASFIPAPPPDLSNAVSISAVGNNAIAIVTLIVIVAAMVTSSVDRRASVEAQRLSQDLERRVLERTLELEAVNQALRKEIAERERAEESVRRSEDRLRLVIDTLPALVWSKLPDGSADFLNQRFLEYTGLSAEEALGWGWMNEFHPEDRAEEEWRAAFAAGEYFEREAQLRRADGAYRWFLLRAVPLRDELGNVVKWYGTSTDIEDRKRAEDELRRQKEVFQKIFENIPVMIAFMGEDRHVELVNPDWERTIGWTLKEIREQNLDIYVELFPDPQYRQMVLDVVAAATGEWIELKVRTRGGRVMDVAGSLVRLSDGSIVGIGRDVTERKQAEEALRRSEAEAKVRAEELAVIFDAVPGMTLISRDPACRRITGSRVAYELLQLPYGANISKSAPEGERPSNFRVVRDGQELPPSELPLQKAAATGQEVRDSEYALLFDDGTRRDMFGNAAPLLDSNGNVRGSMGVFVDITERKRAEKSLRLFRMLVDQSSDAIEVIDPETLRFIDVNGRACSDLGYSREELLSMSVYDISPNAEVLNPKVSDELRSSGSTIFESVHRRRDGSTFPVEISIKQVNLDRTYRVSVIRDITKRKRAEQALQESQAALARVARIATMGELTASIAHEINQPLAAVATNASASLRWLASQPPNLAEARQAMANAMNEANRASGVIDRLRTLLQKTPIQPRPVDVNEVIRDVLALAHRELITGGVATRTELAPDLPIVLGDRVQLQQVLLNLIMNAIDAMITIKDRPRTLVIKSARDAENVLVEVQDSGRGLDPTQASRIFDSFFTTKPEGIGMGLSISRSIVEAHGGRLQAEPGPSHGAVFQVILPKAA